MRSGCAHYSASQGLLGVQLWLKFHMAQAALKRVSCPSAAAGHASPGPHNDGHVCLRQREGPGRCHTGEVAVRHAAPAHGAA